MKKCPYCAERIQDEAIKCRYCGEMLTPLPSTKQDADATGNAIEPTTPADLKQPDEGEAGRTDDHERTCQKKGMARILTVPLVVFVTGLLAALIWISYLERQSSPVKTSSRGGSAGGASASDPGAVKASRSIVPFGITKDMTPDHINNQVFKNELLSPLPLQKNVFKLFGPKNRAVLGVFTEFLVSVAPAGSSLCSFGGVHTYTNGTASSRGWEQIRDRIKAQLGRPDEEGLSTAVWRRPTRDLIGVSLNVKGAEVYAVYTFENPACR